MGRDRERPLPGRDEAERVLGFARDAQMRDLTGASLDKRRGQRGVVVLCALRNERGRIAEFLRHYRRGGAAFFAMVDNGSTDGTLEYLRAQADVDLFSIQETFDATRKQGWIMRLIERYGRDRWYMSVDADEHLVFEGSGEVDFQDAAARFERAGVTRPRGRLIDMYCDTAVLAACRPPDISLAQAMPYFDADGYEEWNNHQIPSCTGGPRARLCRARSQNFAPQLTKFPFFRLGEGEVCASPHYIWPYAGNFGGETYLGLLHYKFDEDALTRIRDALDRNVYWNASAEYRIYLDALRADPLLSFHHGGSRRYRDPRDLVEAGLIAPLPERGGAADMAGIARRAKTARLAQRTAS